MNVKIETTATYNFGDYDVIVNRIKNDNKEEDLLISIANVEDATTIEFNSEYDFIQFVEFLQNVQEKEKSNGTNYHYEHV